MNAAFDIVSDVMTAAAEAECLFVVDEILSAFPLAGNIVHVLNHSKILEALIAGLPASRRPAVLEILVTHGRLQRAWSKTATEMLKIPGVTKAMCDELAAVDGTGELHVLALHCSRLTAISLGTIASMRGRVLTSSSKLKHSIQEGFDELQDVLDVCQRLGLKNVKVAPLLATNWDFHRDGTLFETHHVRGKIRDVIAAGGR